jgi:uracil phosphoribosyltransferase
MPLHVATHPLIAHKMTILRDVNTSSQDFRRVLREITFYLGYEATRTLTVDNIEVNTHLGTTEGCRLAESISIIPILRAGTGMCDAMLDLIPKAAVHHIGMYRSKGTRLPVQYYNRLPKEQASDVAFIVDPCIATAETIRAVCSIVERWGAKRIVVVSVIGAKEGVEKLLALHPNIEIFLGTLDAGLTAEGNIFPGIGDAGDRLFGTPSEIDFESGHEISAKKQKIDDSTIL